ncbi:MAG: hypothetical protein AB7G11_01670 [Phycisphaerales bacterium]
MWWALPVLVFLALLIIPATRPAIAWVFTLLIVPPMLWRRVRFAARPAMHPIDPADPVIPERCRNALAFRAAELAALQFSPQAAWRIDKSEGISDLYILMHADKDRRVLACTTITWTRSAVSQNVIGFDTSHERVRLCTLNSARGPAGDPPFRNHYFPSLTKAEWLLQAHRALEVRLSGPGSPVPLPTDADAWLDRYTSDRSASLQCMHRAGDLRYSRRRDEYRMTLRGIVKTTRSALAPWAARELRAITSREEQLLIELGQSPLLELARRQAADQPAVADGLQIRDDRGSPRRVANQQTAAGDDRNADTRFRSILQLSAQARQSVLRPASTRHNALLVGLVIAAVLLGVLFSFLSYALIGVVVIGSIILQALRSAGKVVPSEEAAAQVLLRHGLCASCLYNLGDLSESDDRCLVCPECGAAWRRDRIQSFSRFDSAVPNDSAVHNAKQAFSMLGFGADTGSTCKDDRGSPRMLVSPHLRTHIGAAVGEQRDRLLAARADTRRIGRWFRWIAACLIFALFIGLPLFAIISTTLRSGRAVSLGLIVGVGMGGLLFIGVIRGNFGFSPAKVRRTMLRHRLCPSCAEFTGDKPPAVDGCITCDCGAVWRVSPPLVSAIDPAPPPAPGARPADPAP